MFKCVMGGVVECYLVGGTHAHSWRRTPVPIYNIEGSVRGGGGGGGGGGGTLSVSGGQSFL